MPPVQTSKLEIVLDDVYGEAKELKVRIEASSIGISVYVEGYGNNVMDIGHGCVIHMENCAGNFRADMYTDMKSEEPTHTIYFDDAREELRTPDSE